MLSHFWKTEIHNGIGVLELPRGSNCWISLLFSNIASIILIINYNIFSTFFVCRFWTHLVMAYVFTFWTCYVLKREYEIVAAMRLHFLASEQRRPDQFTVSTILLFYWSKMISELHVLFSNSMFAEQVLRFIIDFISPLASKVQKKKAVRQYCSFSSLCCWLMKI